MIKYIQQHSPSQPFSGAQFCDIHYIQNTVQASPLPARACVFKARCDTIRLSCLRKTVLEAVLRVGPQGSRATCSWEEDAEGQGDRCCRGCEPGRELQGLGWGILEGWNNRTSCAVWTGQQGAGDVGDSSLTHLAGAWGQGPRLLYYVSWHTRNMCCAFNVCHGIQKRLGKNMHSG